MIDEIVAALGGNKESREKKMTLPKEKGVSVLNTWFDNCKDKRSSGAGYEREYKWMENRYFYEGNHYVTDRDLKNYFSEGEKFKQAKGIRRVVHKAAKHIDTQRKILLTNDPTPTVYPPFDPVSGKDPDYVVERDEYVLGVRKDVKDFWKKLKIKLKLQDIVLNAFLHNVSWVYFGIDGVSKELYMDIHEAFDIYVPYPEKEVEDQPYIIRETYKNISDIRKNPMYDTSKVGDIHGGRYSSVDAFDNYMKHKYGDDSAKGEALIQEFWIKVYPSKNTDIQDSESHNTLKELNTKISSFEFLSEKKEEKKNKYGEECQIRLITLLNREHIIRDETFKELDFYPMERFVAKAGGMYKPAIIERFMSLNRSYNTAVSKTEDSILKGAGKWFIQEDDIDDIITDEEGQKITYRDVAPTYVPSQPNVSGIDNFMNLINSMIVEQGASAVAMGIAPSGVRADNALQTLKGSDETDLSDTKNLLEDFIANLTMKMVKLQSIYIDSVKYVADREDPMAERMPMIGQRKHDEYMQQAPNEEKQMIENGLLVIPKDIEIDIEIETGVFHTPQGKRDTLDKWIQYGAIDPQTYLEENKFGNAEEVVVRLAQKMKMEAEAAAQAQNASMMDTEDFKQLPPELQQQILETLSGKTANEVVSEAVDPANSSFAEEPPMEQMPQGEMPMMDDVDPLSQI